MRHSIIRILSIFWMTMVAATLLGHAESRPVETAGAEAKVYVCLGPSSKRYHKTSKCRGLKSCSKSIKEVTVSEAEKMGRTRCGICY